MTLWKKAGGEAKGQVLRSDGGIEERKTSHEDSSVDQAGERPGTRKVRSNRSEK